jgi:hypothetical protein
MQLCSSATSSPSRPTDTASSPSTATPLGMMSRPSFRIDHRPCGAVDQRPTGATVPQRPSDNARGCHPADAPTPWFWAASGHSQDAHSRPQGGSPRELLALLRPAGIRGPGQMLKLQAVHASSVGTRLGSRARSDRDGERTGPRLLVKNHATSREWAEVEPGSLQDRQPTPLEDAIERALTARNLLVLAGLGTSLGISGPLGSAPTMRNLWETVQEETGSAFTDALEKANYDATDVEAVDIETFLSKCQAALSVTDDPDLADFVAAAERIIARLCRFVEPDQSLPTHETFLRRIVRRGRDDSRLGLFTTNYDLSFEVAASRIGSIVVDGFGYSFPSTFDPRNYHLDIVREGNAGSLERIPELFRLYKLHGSVDWERTGASIRKNAMSDNPVIVYPRRQKYELSYEPPFFDAFSSFNAGLREEDVSIIIIGFGFRDRHISQPMISAMSQNPDLQSIIVDPGLTDDGPSEAHRRVNVLIDAGDARHTLVAGTFEAFVSQLPELRSLTQRELHETRVGDFYD